MIGRVPIDHVFCFTRFLNTWVAPKLGNLQASILGSTSFYHIPSRLGPEHVPLFLSESTYHEAVLHTYLPPFVICS